MFVGMTKYTHSSYNIWSMLQNNAQNEFVIIKCNFSSFFHFVLSKRDVFLCLPCILVVFIDTHFFYLVTLLLYTCDLCLSQMNMVCFRFFLRVFQNMVMVRFRIFCHEAF